MPGVSIRLSTCLILLAIAGVVCADEWSATPSVQVRMQHDDNINLSIDSPVSVWGTSVSPLLDLRKRTALSMYGIGARLTFNRYSEDSVRDTNSQLLTFAGRSNTRLDRFGLAGSYRRDTTFATIAGGRDVEGEDATGGDEEDDTDAGVVRTEVRRHRLSLNPSWTRALTRVTSTRVGYSLNDTKYSDDAGTSLVDFRRHGINAALLHNIDQRDEINVSVAFSKYRAPDREVETDDYNISAGVAHEFSPLLRGELALGISSVTTTFGNDEDKSSGSSFNASLVKKQSEQTMYRLFLERDLYPSGVGTLVLSDRLRINYSHDVSPTLSLSLWANAFRNRSLDFFSAAADRVYYNLEPAFRWNLARLWSVDGSYRYRWQKYDDQDDAAESGAVFLAVNYAWPRMAVSR